MECYLKTLVKQNVKCCQCDGSLADAKHLNIVQTGKLAKWKFPSAGNFLIENCPPEAVAIICDQCVSTGNIKPVYAIESEPGYKTVTYHKIEDLEDEPEWVKKAKEKLSIPSPIMN